VGPIFGLNWAKRQPIDVDGPIHLDLTNMASLVSRFLLLKGTGPTTRHEVHSVLEISFA
jgi:hypothetical protein